MFDPTMPPVLPMPHRPGGWRVALIAIVGGALLVLTGLWVEAEYERGITARTLLSRSYERRILIADLMTGLKEAESGRRGYRITGDPAFLATYRAATAQIADRRGRIAALLIAVPRQSVRFAELNRAIDARLAGLAQAHGIAGDRDGARWRERSRAVAAAMLREEDRMIRRRQTLSTARSSRMPMRVWMLVAGLTALAWGTLLYIWRARRTRYRLQIAAQEATARLHGVFVGTGDAIALIDADGAIEAVNPAVTQMLGHVPATLIGRDLGVLVDVLPIAGALEERLGLVDGHLAEPLRPDRTAQHADGHPVPVDVSLGLMPMPTGLHVVAALRDISDRKAVERIKDEFVATVSHELRTPLTSIVGALGLLRATAAATALPDSGRRLVAVAEENAQRLIQLVNDLLDIERMDAGGLRFRDVPLELAAVLRRVAQAGEGLAAVKQVRIALALGTGPIPVQGDEGRLAQVTTNLLANAIRFSPAGGTVTIRAERDDGRVRVLVEDRGPGVPPDFRERLFTRFAQSEETGPAGGTGLGLAISRQIIRAHRGTIWFEPRAGGGASFGFSIALRMPDTDPPHVLICAAVPEVAVALRAAAEAGGCTADRVDTVADAQAALRSGVYDAVMLCTDRGCGHAGSRLLAILTGAAIAGRLSIPVAVRTDGRILVGTSADPAGWSPIEHADTRLADRIRVLRAEMHRGRPLILHMDGDSSVIDRTATALERRARLRRATDVADAAAIAARERPAILILDQIMADAAPATLAEWLATPGDDRMVTILYSVRPVAPALERRVDIVVAKSARSAPNLIAAVDRALATLAARADAPPMPAPAP